MGNFFERVLDGSDRNKKENVFLGVIGAFLFSLAGALCWIGLHYANFIAAVSGFIGVVAAIWGYKLLGGKLTKKGIVIAAIFAIISLVIGWYVCFALDIREAYQSWFEEGEVEYVPTFFECISIGPEFLAVKEIRDEYIKDLVFGLILALAGGCGFVVRAFKNTKAAETAAEEAPPPVTAFDEFDYDENGMPKRVEKNDDDR